MDYRYILALGSNLGNRPQNLKFALAELKKHGICLRESEIIDTPPLPHADFETRNDPCYLNMVIEYCSLLLPDQLYAHIQIIENELGRNRSRRWLPRALDIDILLMSENSVGAFKNCKSIKWSENDLQVPHLGLKNRPFLWNLLMNIDIDSHCLHSHGIECIRVS